MWSYYFFTSFLFPLFSFSSPLGTPIMQTLVCLMSQRCFKLFSVFKTIFSIQLRLFPILYLLACWSVSLYHLIFKISSSVFFKLLYSSSLFGSFLILSSSLLNSLCSYKLLLSLSIFVITTLNSLSARLLISLSLSSSGVLSYSFIWNIFIYLFSLPDSLWLHLHIRYVCYVSWCWRSGLI